MIAALEQVEVEYGRRGRALGPFSLGVRTGEIVAVVGPSGCGKSTALRLLAGLEQPTRGEVRRTVGRGETAVVFQAPTLAPWASARANVALPLELAGVSDARARADAALARVGLAGHGEARPAQLSGGMAMRVALARALVTDPKLLLLDEPFAALDALTRRRLVEDLHRVWNQSRPAVVFITHDVEEAVYLAGRVVVMTPGPGRTAAEIAIEAPLPRADGFRTSLGFREAVAAVEAALAQAEAVA